MSGSPSSAVNHPSIDELEGTEKELFAAEAASSYSDNILHAFVARNKILLTEVGVHPSEDVLWTVQDLLNREPELGWTSASKRWGSSIAGLKFHVYELIQGAEVPLVWSFACVYDSSHVTKRQAKLFLQKIVSLTERSRFCNDTWRHGGYHACKRLFSPTLLQCMQEVACNGNTAIADDNLELSKPIIAANRKVVHEFELKKSRKKQAEKQARDPRESLQKEAKKQASDVRRPQKQVDDDKSLLKVAFKASHELLSWVKPNNASKKTADHLIREWKS